MNGYRRARRRHGYARFPSRQGRTRRALVTFIGRFEEAAPTLARSIGIDWGYTGGGAVGWWPIDLSEWKP